MWVLLQWIHNIYSIVLTYVLKNTPTTNWVFSCKLLLYKNCKLVSIYLLNIFQYESPLYIDTITARHCAKSFICAMLFNVHKTTLWRYYYTPFYRLGKMCNELSQYLSINLSINKCSVRIHLRWLDSKDQILNQYSIVW